MRALILAAGVGHRLAPLTDRQPKCLLPVGGRSLLERMLEALAGLIYMLAVVVDHSDGEVARLTFQESAFGEGLDFAVDTATHALLVLAMGVTASRTGGAPMLLAGAAAALGVVMSALAIRSLHEAPLQEETFSAVLKELGTRDLFYVVLLAFIFLLWQAPRTLPALVTSLALGSQGYWLTCLARRAIG